MICPAETLNLLRIREYPIPIFKNKGITNTRTKLSDGKKGASSAPANNPKKENIKVTGTPKVTERKLDFSKLSRIVCNDEEVQLRIPFYTLTPLAQGRKRAHERNREKFF